ncbi:MAG: hypothetical protein ACOVN0_04230 [Niveispirillum sp.]|uniref:hypothetical protein n=1 Tax=Niveispirillum sp. TaxID=1917217 RepID=UPI003BA672DE
MRFGSAYGLFVAVVALCLLTQEAHAYVDPGRSSVVQQIMASGVTGLLVALRNFFGGLFGKSPSKTDEAGKDTDAKGRH